MASSSASPSPMRFPSLTSSFRGDNLIQPHGGSLVNLIAEGSGLEQVIQDATNAPFVLTLTPRQICDLEMLMNGGFSPLTGFLNEDDYLSVVNTMHLANGLLWPMPINLDVSEEFAQKVPLGSFVALRDPERRLLALLTVESKYKPDKALEAERVLGSPDDTTHPAIKYLLESVGEWYLGGAIRGVALPVYFDYTSLRNTPAQLRETLRKMYWDTVVGFQTRNPMHRSHREVTLRAARQAKANILIHPVVGLTKPGDVDHYTRVRCYIELVKTYPPGMAILSLLPLAMRMAGPREALWHGIIRQNYGCSHFCVGRDHAGPGKNRAGQDFYDVYEAQRLAAAHQHEVEIKFLFFQEMLYVEELGEYLTADEAKGLTTRSISGTELRRRLYRGIPIPDWFSFPNVVKILQETYPPRDKQGFTIFFTGLSGSGKTTLANAFLSALLEDGKRPVTLLDGEEIRHHLASELGFSKQDRDMNVHRVGYVASLITKSGGVALCSMISPYDDARKKVRQMISEVGGFILVHLSTPLEVCEARDIFGLYAKARAGEIQSFTGISDPYETPADAQIVVDTSRASIRQGVHNILLWLEQEGYLAENR
ncbi:MAG: bifunctional sulfate adenylyltransferase/adenylylsulfate kinase [archaeon]|nr:bifunctional sulfate adenylyltransferase/adenylylsulfate kinase [archaeon]